MDHPVSKAAQKLVDALSPYMAMNPSNSGKITVEIDVRRGQASGVRMRDTQIAQFTIKVDKRISTFDSNKKMVDLSPESSINFAEQA